ncbi:hypothetical protein A2765_02835 [Candidatus Kaiserbacteria bacterium RIFCSPHIGHO2_01_FULL_56_24]|uniref:Uncharacterized protein n=1 Tax=Candidatus Kaiserbacteria bacterium RIFCSPHIGHO2_01_FULL_56_24 TaxID=1798487 RepID=A0A1F6DB45_9BACT|nr:MAG: hypothetical protein A2765_02835 [Candidatus Kaiserbacteria bacterium RIFCSPHIGHO2_01_FULL_56_24]
MRTNRSSVVILIVILVITTHVLSKLVGDDVITIRVTGVVAVIGRLIHLADDPSSATGTTAEDEPFAT